MARIEWKKNKVDELRKIMASGASVQQAANLLSATHGSIASACRKHKIKKAKSQGNWQGINQHIKTQQPLPAYGVMRDPFGVAGN